MTSVADMAGARWRSDTAGALAIALILVAIAWAMGLHRTFRIAVYTEQFLALCLALAVAHAFLVRPPRHLPPRLALPIDTTLAALALFGGIGLAIGYPDLSLAAAIDPGRGLPWALPLLATLLVALVRVAGWPLPVVVLCFVAYGLWGSRLPGQFQALPIPPERLAVQLALDTGGVLGTPLAIACTVVVVFVAFGRLLDHLGGAAFFTDLAMAAMGGFRGGAAKIALAASALFGSISGSAVSNVATTGIITIPLMRRSGFSRERAAGVEAVASTGGQLTPPVMGAAAFLMAEFLEIRYADVILAALVPAALYYVALLLLIDLSAARDGIAGVPAAERPVTGQVMKAGWVYILPFIGLLWAMFVLNYQPATAGLVAGAILLLVAPLVATARSRLGPRGIVTALATAGGTLGQIVIITAAAGIVIGVLNETGLGFGLTAYLVGFADDQVLLLLLLAACVSIVLGMGMPTIAVYVLLATLVAPALIRLGVQPTAAHLFVLYFGMMSMITPPVAIAAFAAASIAGAGPLRTALSAMRFGWPAFVLPFAFAFNPALILQQDAGAALLAVGTALIGVICISVALSGHMRGRVVAPLRVGAAAVGAAALLWPVLAA